MKQIEKGGKIIAKNIRDSTRKGPPLWGRSIHVNDTPLVFHSKNDSFPLRWQVTSAFK